MFHIIVAIRYSFPDLHLQRSFSQIRVGGVSFSTVPRVEWYLDQYFTQQEVIDAVRRIVHVRGRANLAGGLETTRTQVLDPSRDRQNVRNIVIVLTGGEVSHWNKNVVILTKFSSLATLEVVILTTSSAASDEHFIKMKTFPFQWYSYSDLTWTSWRLKAPVLLLFAQQLIQVNNQENIKTFVLSPHYKRIHRDRTKDQ